MKYDLFPLSPVSRHRLGMVHRKTLVLDLDETLIHSHHDAMPRNTVKPGTPHDFTVKVTIDRHPVRFFVHKRPHVDFFLDVVSQSLSIDIYELNLIFCFRFRWQSCTRRSSKFPSISRHIEFPNVFCFFLILFSLDYRCLHFFISCIYLYQLYRLFFLTRAKKVKTKSNNDQR